MQYWHDSCHEGKVSDWFVTSCDGITHKHTDNHYWWPLVYNIALITGNTQSRASLRLLTVTSPVFMPNSNWALGSFIWAWLGWAMDRFSLQLHTHHPQQQLQHHENRIVQWCTCSNTVTVTSMHSCTSLTSRPNTACSFASYSSENILSSNKMNDTTYSTYILYVSQLKCILLWI